MRPLKHHKFVSTLQILFKLSPDIAKGIICVPMVQIFKILLSLKVSVRSNLYKL